jgi:hypothetical protein
MTSPTDPPAADPRPPGHPLLVYTGLRLVLFAIPFLILLLLSVPLVWSLLLSALLSSVASLFLLGRFRDQLSIAFSARRERVRQRMAGCEQAEDQWDETRRQGESDRD